MQPVINKLSCYKPYHLTVAHSIIQKMTQKVNTYTTNKVIVIFAYFCITKTTFSVDILGLLCYHTLSNLKLF